jgi:hypothetical protein
MRSIRRGALVAVVVAVALVAVPQASVAQSAKAPTSVERTQRMTQKDAKSYIARYMKQIAKRYWRLGHDKKIYNCKNLSPIRVRCKVSWYYKEKLYVHGSGTAYYKPNDPEHVYLRRSLKVENI